MAPEQLDGPQFRILEFPDPILVQICEQLPETSILSVSSSCRRLNEIALGIYLAQNDITEPAVKCEVVDWEDTGTLNILHALNIATFFHCTEHFSLIFFNGNLSQLSRDLDRCSRLVQRLSPLQKVSLEFRHTIGANVVGDEKAQKQWNASFINLWMAVLKNGSVTSFAIRTKWDFMQSYMRYADSHPRSRTRVQAQLTTGLRQLRKKIDLVVSTRRVLSELPSGRSTVTALHIETPILFLPELYHLTVATLRYSPVTSLALHSLPSRSEWARVFEDVVTSLPDLEELSLVGVDAHPQILSRFLSRA
ncbi:hypothetical protein C8R43DRAFT_1166038 [Mycena crocata]|nr:hypothetical protein C8R43DRAFT_1166038 [Mycena crocata]